MDRFSWSARWVYVRVGSVNRNESAIFLFNTEKSLSHAIFLSFFLFYCKLNTHTILWGGFYTCWAGDFLFFFFYLSSFGSFTAPSVNMYCYYSFFIYCIINLYFIHVCWDIEHSEWLWKFPHTLVLYYIFRLQLLIYWMAAAHTIWRTVTGVWIFIHMWTSVRFFYIILDTTRCEVHILRIYFLLLLIIIIIISPFAILRYNFIFLL